MLSPAPSPAMTADRILPPQAAQPGPRTRAMLSGGIHVLLLAGLARMVLPAPPPAPSEWTVPLVFLPAEPAPAPATPIAAADLPPPAMTETIGLAPLRRIRLAAAPPRPPAQAAPAPTPTAAAPPAPRALPPPPAPDSGWIATFTGQVQAAVQRAAIYPMAARLQRRQGRVRVRFDYAGGAPAAASILIGSSEPVLDRAALRAVQFADYPPAPAALGRTRLQMLVWVDFRLEPES